LSLAFLFPAYEKADRPYGQSSYNVSAMDSPRQQALGLALLALLILLFVFLRRIWSGA